MMDKVYSVLFSTLWTCVLLAIFYGLVKLLFFVAGTEPGYFHRWRPWVVIAVMWCLYGFAVRFSLGLLSGGMISTPGVWSVLSMIGWPVFFFVMFGWGI